MCSREGGLVKSKLKTHNHTSTKRMRRKWMFLKCVCVCVLCGRADMCFHLSACASWRWISPLALVYDWNSTSAEPPSTCTINHPPAPMRCYVTLQSFTDTGVALPKMEPVNPGSWAAGVDSSFCTWGWGSGTWWRCLKAVEAGPSMCVSATSRHNPLISCLQRLLMLLVASQLEIPFLDGLISTVITRCLSKKKSQTKLE